MTPTLRDYQQECLHTILAQYRAGVHRQLVSLPTGTGKTVIFAAFPHFFRMKKRMLVLAHREELLDQARDKILRSNPALSVEIEQAGRSAGGQSQVVVASVATLGRKDSARLKRLDPQDFYLVVVDEAHHAIAPTYRRVLERLGVLETDTDKLLVGFTATPKRGDGQGLDRIFDEIVFSRTLPEMIYAGYLSPVAGYRVETDVDLSEVRMRMGDFVTSHLSQAVNITARNDLVVKVYKDHLADQQTLCFCVDVAHALSLAESFRAAGISAAAVTGSMDSDVRRQALADFAAAHTQVITNCMVLTEGYDESSVSGIILARPTRSSLLYTQMIGRGTRLHPGKECVTIIDIVDVTKDHTLVTLPSLFGFSDQFDLQGKTTSEVEEALRWVEHSRPWVRADLATSLSDLRYRCRRIELLDLRVPRELDDYAGLAWTAIGPRAYKLSLAKGESIAASSTILGKWEITLRSGRQDQVIGTAANPITAIRKAEHFVKNSKPDSVGLVLRGTRWRGEPVSQKQLDFLVHYGLEIPEELTKGQASHLIALISMKKPNPPRTRDADPAHSANS